MTFQAAGRTDVGLARKENQDHYLILHHKQVYAVADGMGGHAGGGQASTITVDTLKRKLENARVINKSAVEDALAEADAGIQEVAGEMHWEGMGTTLVLAYCEDDLWEIAHIGDSRAYAVSGGAIVAVTKDHSLVEELLAHGTITQEEARLHPHRNVLTRALGVNGDPVPEWSQVAVRDAQYLLLCTDGLYNMVDEKGIMDIVLAHGLSLEEKTARLVEEANRLGGMDNITVVLVAKEDGQ